VVQELSVPAILGCDFLTKHGVILNFEQGAYQAKHASQSGALLLQQPHSCMVVLDDEYPQTVPTLHNTDKSLDMPTDYHTAVSHMVQEHATIFKQELGHIPITDHVIVTGDSHPIKVPQRPILFHYVERVHQQLQDMAKEGIIQPSNSPWCAPAVYVNKSNGEIHICLDFVQLNKVTKKDAYPVPRTEGPQQKLANKHVFSKIDLKSAYWQFPMNEDSIEKTVFCPRHGYGLWEFTVMPYGLTGATCQRKLDKDLADCKDCVNNYVDDCIVFSDNMQSHIQDLRRVLGRLQAVIFTLCGSKCSFGHKSVIHLGLTYSSSGTTTAIYKGIINWPVPTSVKEVRSLGLANFYQRFIPNLLTLQPHLQHSLVPGFQHQCKAEILE